MASRSSGHGSRRFLWLAAFALSASLPARCDQPISSVAIVAGTESGELIRLRVVDGRTEQLVSDWCEGPIRALALSPDGDRVCWRAEVEGQNGDLFVTDAAPGSRAMRMTHSGDWGNPVWMPDGRRVLCDRRPQAYGTLGIWLIDPRTGQVQEAVPADDTWSAFGFRASPDGRYVALERGRHYSTIDVLDLADPGRRILELATGYGADACWLPDSSALLVGSMGVTDQPARRAPSGLWLFTVDDIQRGLARPDQWHSGAPLLLAGQPVGRVQAVDGQRCFAGVAKEGALHIVECALGARTCVDVCPPLSVGDTRFACPPFWCAADRSVVFALLGELEAGTGTLMMYRRGTGHWEPLQTGATCFHCVGETAEASSRAAKSYSGKPPIAPASAQASPSSQTSGTIAFIREGNIWLMGPDGADQRQLSHSGKCAHPSWSPGGTSLVFESSGDIWRMELPSQKLQRLTTTGDCHQPAWRPGTNEVWYLRFSPASGWEGYWATIWAATVELGKARQVAKVRDPVSSPTRTTWRTDGQLLAVDISIANADGGYAGFYTPDGRQLTVHTEGQDEPWLEFVLDRWSPSWCPVNQSLVAFSVEYGILGGDMPAEVPSASLVVLDQRTGLATHLVDDHGRLVTAPSWSPGGDCIAFCRGSEAWAIGRDGGGLRKIADNAAQPAWSPAP